MFVTEDGNNRVQAFDSRGNFITKWGGGLNIPQDIALDPSTGNVFVADTFNNRVQVFDSTGNFIGKWGTKGTGDGQFDRPWGIAVNPSTGNVFVSDTFNNRIQVFEFDGSTATFITKWGSQGTGDGQFNRLLVLQ